MSENVEGPKNNMFFVGHVGKFLILAFLEALKTKFNDF